MGYSLCWGGKPVFNRVHSVMCIIDVIISLWTFCRLNIYASWWWRWYLISLSPMVRWPNAVDRSLKSKNKLLFHPEWAYAVGKLKSKKSLLLWVTIFDGVVGVSGPSCIMFHVVLACALGPNVLGYVTNVALYPWLVKTKLQMFLSEQMLYLCTDAIHKGDKCFCPQYSPTLEGLGKTGYND